MAARSIVRTYQLASRIWLTAAALSLLLPADARRGLWLTLHLALAGAVSVAISGAMQNFALTLSAAPDAPAAVVWSQFAAVNTGALLVTIGYASRAGALVSAGGTLFVAAALLLGWLVVRARRIGLDRRHAMPFAMYAAAIVAVVIGGALVLGIGVLSLGLVSRSSALEVAGAAAYAAGALGVASMAARVIRAPRRWPIPSRPSIWSPLWHGSSPAR